MTALVLDTRALELLADPKTDARAAERLRKWMRSATQLQIPVHVPAAVLAEAYRGRPSDARVDRVLKNGVRVITTGKAAAKIAGGLKDRDQLNSCHTVDSLVVATSIRLGGGIVATGDPDDLRSLARHNPNVDVRAL